MFPVPTIFVIALSLLSLSLELFRKVLNHVMTQRKTCKNHESSEWFKYLGDNLAFTLVILALFAGALVNQFRSIFLFEVSILGQNNYNWERMHTLNNQKLLKEHSSGSKDQRNQQIIGYYLVLASLLWTCTFQHLSFETGLSDLVSKVSNRGSPGYVHANVTDVGFKMVYA